MFISLWWSSESKFTWGRHKWGMKVVFSCGKRSANSSLPLLHRKHIFLLFFLTILRAYNCWANFRNMCSINMTLKKINTRSLGLCNYLACQAPPNYVTTRHLEWLFTCGFSPAADTHLAHSRYLIQSCRTECSWVSAGEVCWQIVRWGAILTSLMLPQRRHCAPSRHTL